MAKVVFAKEKGKPEKENLIVNLEEFISIKGIKALGNHLSTEKVKEIITIESLPPHQENEMEENLEEELGDDEITDSSDESDGLQTELEF